MEHGNLSKRKKSKLPPRTLPGPLGDLEFLKNSNLVDSSSSSDFQKAAWLSMLKNQDINPNESKLLDYSIEVVVQNRLTEVKDKFILMLERIVQDSSISDFKIEVKDPTGKITGTMKRSILSKYKLTPGCVICLVNVKFFYPANQWKPLPEIVITNDNVIQVVCKDCGPVDLHIPIPTSIYSNKFMKEIKMEHKSPLPVHFRSKSAETISTTPKIHAHRKSVSESHIMLRRVQESATYLSEDQDLKNNDYSSGASQSSQSSTLSGSQEEAATTTTTTTTPRKRAKLSHPMHDDGGETKGSHQRKEQFIGVMDTKEVEPKLEEMKEEDELQVGHKKRKKKKKDSLKKSKKEKKKKKLKKEPREVKLHKGRDSSHEESEEGMEFDSECEYEIEAILNERVVDGRVEYEVKFKGYDDQWNEWLPIENLHCDEALKAYQLGVSVDEVDDLSESATSDEEPDTLPHYVHKRVEVFWSATQSYYTGTVIKYNSKKGYRMRFDEDSSEMWIRNPKRFHVLDDATLDTENGASMNGEDEELTEDVKHPEEEKSDLQDKEQLQDGVESDDDAWIDSIPELNQTKTVERKVSDEGVLQEQDKEKEEKQECEDEDDWIFTVLQDGQEEETIDQNGSNGEVPCNIQEQDKEEEELQENVECDDEEDWIFTILQEDEEETLHQNGSNEEVACDLQEQDKEKEKQQENVENVECDDEDDWIFPILHEEESFDGLDEGLPYDEEDDEVIQMESITASAVECLTILQKEQKDIDVIEILSQSQSQQSQHTSSQSQRSQSQRISQHSEMNQMNVKKSVISQLFKHIPTLIQNQQNEGLVVLSLFDGIGSAAIALLNLGIKIKSYYTSEIDKDAERVAIYQLRKRGVKVIALGDIRDKRFKAEIMKINPDLIIAGSPCQDLSLLNRKHNHKKKFSGLQGEKSRLFWNFVEILNTKKKQQPGVLFLFENVAMMRPVDKKAITEALGVQPISLDAKDFSSTRRPRLYWTNIKVLPHFDIVDRTLAEDLSQDRVPLNVHDPKGKTITVQKRYYKPSAEDSERYNLVVNMKDKTITDLKVTEIERILGFESDYTNVHNLSEGARRRLLGNSFSIPVMMHLLRPLLSLHPDHSKDVEARVQNTLTQMCIPQST